LTERMDLYLGLVTTLMFLAGCVLIVLSVRERSEERRRWRGPTAAKPPATRRKQTTMNPNGNLERFLESAVVRYWDDLMRGASTGLIHIEYGFAVGDTLDYLKVWSSISRGHWLLACQYWMSANTFHGAGVGFENGYKSEGLAHILETTMQHQTSFVLPANLGRQGLLQISTPTAEGIAAAAALINAALDRLGSLPAVV
jgi:hypothetical protein